MMTELRDLIDQCAETTKAKGFDVTQHGTQLALMATEIGEALEVLTDTGDATTDYFLHKVIDYSRVFEQYRKKKTKLHIDNSAIIDPGAFLEELADIQIRLCSYIGGNGLTDQFMEELQEKIEKNKNRPMKHGKAF